VAGEVKPVGFFDLSKSESAKIAEQTKEFFMQLINYKSRLRLQQLIGAVVLQALIACSEQEPGAGRAMPGKAMPEKTLPVSSANTDAATPAPIAIAASVDINNPCELLTQADAATAFGEPAYGDGPASGECWWRSKSTLKTVKIINSTADGEAWKAGYQNASWAQYAAFDEGFQSLVLSNIVFRRGTQIYDIGVNYSTDGDVDAIVKSLAKTVEARLRASPAPIEE
jgi:hypothetical protein